MSTEQQIQGGIMRGFSAFTPQLLLRIGLAVIFLYAAISSFTNPQDWVGYLPSFATKAIDAHLLLHFFSAYEITLAIFLLAGVLTRYVALLCAATLIGIVVFNSSLFAITFRDIALMFAALALARMPESSR